MGWFSRQLEWVRFAGAAFANDEKGATSIEYALIGSIVSISIVAGSLAIKGSLTDAFTSVVTAFEQVKD
jgi:pilus assembly protein Flp/PilA